MRDMNAVQRDRLLLAQSAEDRAAGHGLVRRLEAIRRLPKQFNRGSVGRMLSGILGLLSRN